MSSVTIAIVGSRRRTDRASVDALIENLSAHYGAQLIVVSGGATGPDTWAIEAAQRAGIRTRVHRPTLAPGMKYGEIARAYHARNREIAAACDIMFAFVASDRRGGTENAIRHARRLGKRVEIITQAGAPVSVRARSRPSGNGANDRRPVCITQEAT